MYRGRKLEQVQYPLGGQGGPLVGDFIQQRGVTRQAHSKFPRNLSSGCVSDWLWTTRRECSTPGIPESQTQFLREGSICTFPLINWFPGECMCFQGPYLLDTAWGWVWVKGSLGELAYNLGNCFLFSPREGIPELVMQIKGDPELDFQGFFSPQAF